MYCPRHFNEADILVMQSLIRDYPLATLVTLSDQGLEANHIPLNWVDNGSQYGVLVGHVARANPLWRVYAKDVEVLTIFHGPNAYISPTWYASKAEHGRVVPTWNYATVHAYGTLRVHDDADWLREQLDMLTQANEKDFPTPWALADVPAEFTEKLITQIVGIEIEVTRLQGKWKVSQNQPPENQSSVIDGLKGCSRAQSADMATLVEAKMKPLI